MVTSCARSHIGRGFTNDDGELMEILHALLTSNHPIGMDIAILDPELGPDGKYAVELTSTVVRSFHS